MQVGRQDQVHGKQSPQEQEEEHRDATLAETDKLVQQIGTTGTGTTNWNNDPTLNKGRGLIYIGRLIGKWGQVSELMMDRCK